MTGLPDRIAYLLAPFRCSLRLARLKSLAALKSVSMRDYSQAAMERDLTWDESEDSNGQRFDRQAFRRVVTQREALFGGKPLPGIWRT